MSRAISLVNATGIIIGVSYGMHGPILPVFSSVSVGASYAELGLIGLANFVPYMFVPLLVGLLLDRFGSARLLIVGVSINAASLYLLSAAQTVPEIMALRAMTGVAHAFFWPPSEAILSEYSPRGARVKNIARFTGLFVGGFTVGPLLASLMLSGAGDGGEAYRGVFAMSGYVLAAALVTSVPLSRARTRERVQKWSLAAFRRIMAFPEVIVMLLYLTAAFGMILTIYPAFLHERGIGDVEIGVLFFAFGISRIVSLFTAGRLAQRRGLTMSTVTASIAGALLLSFFADGIASFAAAMLLMGFGFSVFFPLTLDIVLGRAARGEEGSMIGVYETIFGIGWTVGPLAAGLISQYWGGAAPYAAFFAAGAAVTAMSVARRGRLEPRGRANP